jgi:tight adherence protein B
MSIETMLLGRVSAALICLGLSLFFAFGVQPYDSPVRKWHRNYEAKLTAQLKLMHSMTTARQFVLGQAIGFTASVLLLIFVSPFLGAIAVTGVPIANIMLNRAQAKRVNRIEEQLDGWVTALANALKATPAIAEAISSTISVVEPPIRQELDLAIKEYHLGTPLDQALVNMAERVGSRTVRTVVSTLIVARTSGGNLPQTLETSAASLREMARLEGVVRTKTAEGKAQAYVISAIPIPVYFGLRAIQPEFYRVLETTNFGNFLFLIAGVFWISAALLARKILAVDI